MALAPIRLVVLMTLYEKALATDLHSRFVARSEELGRVLTDDEVKAEAQYQLDDLPYKGLYEGKDLRRVTKQMERLIKG